ncbi:sensor domain-containing protein [Parasphingorhabdus sp.]|jgi:diguanylate cyclase (GGDEF)-like protein/PAS domain S-box-containing protein|uniref:sensor domain-containing protein n=2 Tax=Parasphingorhabdus sp. TaxID=2709688 RepID=UPI0007F3C55B|nr:diguanylate phosphodiesterase [Sphingomonadales bacterium EhC05]
MKIDNSQFDAEKATDVSVEMPKNFFERMSNRIARQSSKTDAAGPSIETKEALRLLQNYEETRQGWFWSTDKDGNLTYVTESVAQILDKKSIELIGTPFTQLFVDTQQSDENQRTLPFLLTKRSKFLELQLQAATSNDDVRWWEVSGSPQFDHFGEFSGYRGSGKDITSQRQSAQDTAQLAMFDSLTGLANRAQMSKKLDATLSTFQQQKRTCSMMLLDLDHFKTVNDTMGHPAGDMLLKQVAKRLLKAVDDAGEVGRIGGDEFQILLPDWEDRGKLGELANTIISSLSQPYTVEGSRCIIGASIGIAISPFDGLSSDDLIRSSDLALYAAKGSGRGRFQFFARDLQQAAEDRKILEDDLRDALSREEISLHYQPVVNAKNNTVTGFEALMRWNHRERGPVSPAIFIPIAEDANLIGPLGEWALQRACADAVKWPGNVRIAVNVSPIQFADARLPEVVKKALKSTGLAPARLELEITESVFLAETDETDDMFKALKDIGVRLALDDFGTGYSSLSYLQTAPFDKIKIDQSFVRGATEPDSRNGAIIAAIVALANALDMETTAEGIEALDELEWIRELSVSHVQGYVYSMPVKDEDVHKRFETGDWIIMPEGPAKQRSDRNSMFRKVKLIHENSCYDVMIRNLSKTGALIEGLVDVPVGTKFVLDFGDGQIAVSTVRRSMGQQQGIEFEQRLVDDGNGGLCTRTRISPYLIAAAGMEVPNMSADFYAKKRDDWQHKSIPSFYTTDSWKAG